jgi:hypothetical protein
MIAMNQKTLVDDLKRQIACGQVVVVTGTGVSVAVCENQQVDGFSVATWTGLLKHGVHFCQHTESTLDAKEAKAVFGQISVGETDFLVAAAELVTERLRGKRPGAFRGWLKDSVGKLAPTQPDIVKTLASWPVKLTTLNYDHLLEAVTSRPSLTWQDRDKIEEILRYGGDAVIHLHGDFDRPESVILGLSSYAKVVNDSHTQAVLQLFTLGRTLLFVGCGGTFQDPNFSRLIEWGREALKDSTARHFVLCRKSEKAKFVELQKTAPWLYPIVFGAKHEDLLPFLRGLAPAAMPSHPHGPPPKPPSLHLAVYAKAVRDRYAKLKLESLDATGCYYRELELWRVFVPQHVRECQDYLPQVLELPKEHLRRLREEGQIESGELDAERIQELRRRYLDQTPRNALELVDDPVLPKVVILGDPGAGKSCLLQALTLRWAERPELERQRLDLPLLIELRAYAQARERDHINGFLDFWQRSPLALCQLDSRGLRELLEAGQAQVFFDGLDEVFDSALREEVANVIQRFANDFPRVRVVVTSRVIDYKGESFRSADFRHFMLQELEDDQITTFLDRWHRDTYRSTETAERDEKHARLTRAIANSRPIRELAGNPLLLTMMAILNRYRDLPRDRAELYEECSKLLLQQWKVEDALRADPDLAADALAIGLREKQDILRRLAHAMQTGTNGPLGNLIATDRLETIIEDAVKSLVKGNPRAVARALIRHLRGRNFILCFVGGDSYAFVHRTFLEYFCADDLRVRFEHEKSIDEEALKTEVFGPHWVDETWHEVLCLVAGMIHPKALANILGFLLGSVDISSSPNEEGNQVQEGHEVVSGFLETRKDAAIMLDLVEKAFDEVAFLVKMPVVDPRVEAIGTGRDDRLHTAFLHDLHERVGIVALIADHGVGRECPDQPFGLPDVGRWSTGEDEDQGVTQGIGDGMNLGAKAAPRTAQGFRLGGALLRPRRAGVGTNHRAIDQQLLQVGVPHDVGLQLGPDTASLPPGKPLEDMIPSPPCRRQQSPLTATAQHP